MNRANTADDAADAFHRNDGNAADAVVSSNPLGGDGVEEARAVGVHSHGYERGVRK